MCPRGVQGRECETAELLARVCCVLLHRAAVPRSQRLPAPFHLERAIEGVLGTNKRHLHPYHSGTGSLCAWASTVCWAR